MPMAPATVSPRTRSTVRPGAAWRACIDCTLDSGMSTYSPPTNPARVSAMTSGDWSRRTVLSVLVTQGRLQADVFGGRVHRDDGATRRDEGDERQQDGCGEATPHGFLRGNPYWCTGTS